MLVFFTALQNKIINVRHVNIIFGPIVVQNTKRSWRRDGTSPRLEAQDIPAAYLKEGESAPAGDRSCLYREISCYVDDVNIAVLPRERFHNVVPGEENPKPPNVKPYGLREMATSTQQLTDYEQAAHDARRMGWLLQVPGPGATINLVLPTQWHYAYLNALLLPPPPSEKMANVSIDDFLCMVVAKFRPSTLTRYLADQGKLREVIYDQEFKDAVEGVAGADFAIRQSRTCAGDGVADYAIIGRQWVIELMVEGSNSNQHIARFQPSGPYYSEWVTRQQWQWDWRIVDFRFHVSQVKQPGKPTQRLSELGFHIFSCLQTARISVPLHWRWKTQSPTPVPQFS